ncbi:MAG: TIGR04086 family membrane protein [Oscillospiraceae bacterium]|nr:TIGR04086 family membrane protein [Oscillospiraceae bacterium]
MKNESLAKQQERFLKTAKPVIIGSLTGIAVCLIMLFIFAFLFVNIRIMPQPAVNSLSILSMISGVFLGSYISARISKEKGFFYGACTGIVLFFMLLLISVTIVCEPFSMLVVIKFFSLLISGILGGIVGVNKRRR